ncbi:MAG: hypothetical protein C1942_07575 [Prosthecochloris sp.]|nr:hypothetical protein [Prosthecochloris sp.]
MSLSFLQTLQGVWTLLDFRFFWNINKQGTISENVCRSDPKELVKQKAADDKSFGFAILKNLRNRAEAKQFDVK